MMSILGTMFHTLHTIGIKLMFISFTKPPTKQIDNMISIPGAIFHKLLKIDVKLICISCTSPQIDNNNMISVPGTTYHSFLLINAPFVCISHSALKWCTNWLIISLDERIIDITFKYNSLCRMNSQTIKTKYFSSIIYFLLHNFSASMDAPESAVLSTLLTENWYQM